MDSPAGGGGGGSSGAVTNAGTFAVQLTGATNNINNIAGTISLPTGASTSANQTSQITQETAIAASVASIDTKASLPVPYRAQTQEQNAVSNGTATPGAADATGKQINLPYANPENFFNGQITTAMTVTSDTAVTGMGAQGAGVRNYITACTLSNSHATVGTMMVLKDGSAGTVIAQAPAGAAFAGAQVVFPTPIKTTANTGLFAADITTGANTFVSCTGYKGV